MQSKKYAAIERPIDNMAEKLKKIAYQIGPI
jgi:hypothetical protein